MKDNKIIEVLECCAKMNCKKCPKPDFFKEFTKGLGCNNAICRHALELIKRQQAEIERLTERNFNLSEKGEKVCIALKTAKAEAIKEYAERLKGQRNGDFIFVTVKLLDNLVKEMTEKEV